MKFPKIDLKNYFYLILIIVGPIFNATISAQDNLKIKDANGNILLEAREDGLMIRQMTTAARIAVAGLNSTDNGLIVYDTNSKSLWLWQDTVWIEVDGIDNVNDADNDPANELQNWSSLPGIPAGFADNIDHVDDADSDSLNESNISMTFNDSILELTDNGGMLSVDLSSLIKDGGWTKDTGKIYNTTDNVGIGINDPLTALHVRADKGIDEHVMLIENQNHQGSGLKIKIDGSHPLFVKGQNGAQDFFITHPGKAALATLDSLTGDIRTYLINNTLDISDFSYSDIGTSNGIFAQMGMDVLMTGGMCKATAMMVQQLNDIGLGSVTLPNLPLQSLPATVPSIPNMPAIPNIPNFSVNPPPYQVCGIIGNCYPFNIPAFTVSSNFINNPINTFNSNLGTVNTGIGTTNTAIQTGYSGLLSAAQILDSLVIPLPQLAVPQNLGPITCPSPNPWDSFNISLAPLDPSNYSITNPLSSENAYITFVDQYDNKLGAITGQGLGEFALDYFTPEKVFEIAGKIAGAISPTGSLPGNLLELAKEAFALYKATDKMGVLYSSGHGDYAEWLEREDHAEELGYGDIVGIRGGKISLSLKDAEQIMVVSKAPIVLGNIPEPGKEVYGNNIAFIGQVPVKVIGPVKTGDYIVANPETPGYGIAVSETELTSQQLAMAVGRSWETKPEQGFKYVNTIVGMHDNAWAGPVRSLQQKVNQNETAIEVLTQRLDDMENSGRRSSVSR